MKKLLSIVLIGLMLSACGPVSMVPPEEGDRVLNEMPEDEPNATETPDEIDNDQVEAQLEAMTTK